MSDPLQSANGTDHRAAAKDLQVQKSATTAAPVHPMVIGSMYAGQSVLHASVADQQRTEQPMSAHPFRVGSSGNGNRVGRVKLGKVVDRSEDRLETKNVPSPNPNVSNNI